jgi:Fic family protein
MNHETKQWIWESEKFPHFVYGEVPLETLYYKFGQLKMLEDLLSKESYSELMLDALMEEALSTSAIEGELLQRSSVRSSINRILKLGLEDDYSYTRESDALVEVLLDAKTNPEALTKERLWDWHRALYVNGGGLRKIEVGKYRTNREEMRIVSGPWEKERVHYVAPPSEEVPRLMDDFLTWLNSEDESSGITKAAVAHLYFVLIHPFNDGNGRIARAITDYVLARSNLANATFYSISAAIYRKRKEYYAVLDDVCIRTDQNIDGWMEWFIALVEESINETLWKVEAVKTRARFWDRHKETRLNERQKKVILKMLSYLPEEFEGGMRVQKYMSITKATRLTASRDLNDLVGKGVMKRFGSGRGVYYELLLSEKSLEGKE